MPTRGSLLITLTVSYRYHRPTLKLILSILSSVVTASLSSLHAAEYNFFLFLNLADYNFESMGCAYKGEAKRGGLRKISKTTTITAPTVPSPAMKSVLVLISSLLFAGTVLGSSIEPRRTGYVQKHAGIASFAIKPDCSKPGKPTRCAFQGTCAEFRVPACSMWQNLHRLYGRD